MGSHDELMDQYPNGTYAGFVNQQASAEATKDEDQAEDSDEEHKIAAELSKTVSSKLGVSSVNLKSGISMKKTLSMRKTADPKEIEM